MRGKASEFRSLSHIDGETQPSRNPIPMLAMLKHLAGLQEKEGKTVSVQYSEQLQQMIDDLAAEEGQAAEEYLATLVSEFEETGAGEDEGDEAQAEGDAPADAGEDAQAPKGA